MHLRTALHLFRADWQRLKWLAAGTWLLILLVAWPIWFFSPGGFAMPPRAFDALSLHGWVRESSLSELASPVQEATQLALRALLTVATLFLAGALGYHARGWTQGRPVRAGDRLAAKAIGLGALLVLPLVAVTAIATAIHEPGAASVWRASGQSAAIILPRAIAACLLGALCGGGWRWLAGTLALLIGSSTLPGFFFLRPVAWFADPLALSLSLPDPRLLWLTAGILLVVWLLTPHLTANRRLGLALAAIWLLPPWLPRLYAPIPTPSGSPDLSATVQPALAQHRLQGQLSLFQDPPYRVRNRPAQPVTSLSLALEWSREGMPGNAFVRWTTRSGRLRFEDGATSSLLGPSNGFDFYHSPHPEALAAALGIPVAALTQGSQRHQWNHSEETLTRLHFEPVPAGRHRTAGLELELQGEVFRYDKLLELPLGAPAGAELPGLSLEIRRLPDGKRGPQIDLCAIVPRERNRDFFYESPVRDWRALLYLPGKEEYRLLDLGEVAGSALTPARAAVRCLLHDNHGWSTPPKEDPYARARFILVRRTFLGRAQRSFASEQLPLDLEDQLPDALASKNDRNRRPPLERRPDPARASGEEVALWFKRSGDDSDIAGWSTRNFADYAAGHLELLLARQHHSYPPSIAEGRAIALALPESRRGELIAALAEGRPSREANWLPDVLIRRGWVAEAAQPLRELVREDRNNAYAMLALASLEDPASYPLLLDFAGRNTDPLFCQAIRRLPGVDGPLRESLAQSYQRLKNEPDDHYQGLQESDRRQLLHRRKVYLATVPAAQGVPEAFADLLALAQAPQTLEDPSTWESLGEAIRLPEEQDPRARYGQLISKSPADFRYDPLARWWTLVEPAP